MPKIPKHKWCTVRTQILSRRLDNIQAEMHWSLAQFNKFRNHVIDTSRVLGLDRLLPPEEQDSVKWAELVESCIAAFPALADFEDTWPVNVYFTKYSSNSQHTTRYRLAKRNRKVSQKKSASTDGSDRSTKRHLSKGKAKAGKPKVSQEILAFPSPPPSPEPQIGQKHPVTDDRPPISTPPWTRRTSDSTETQFTGIFWSACVFCGFEPPLTREETCALRQFLRTEPSLPVLSHALTTAGILTDRHLSVLLRLGSTKREEYLKSLVPRQKLDPFEAVQLAIMLEDWERVPGNRDGDGRARKARAVEIPRPGKGRELAFSAPGCRPVYVQECMRVDDEAAYHDLVNVIERHASTHLDMAQGFESQDPERVAEVVDLICQERPSLRQYKDAWPITVHIRRLLASREKASAVPAPTSGGSSSSTASSSSSGMGRRRESTPPGPLGSASKATICHCPRRLEHSNHRVPAAVAARLADCGMHELGPVLHFLGLRSDEQVAKMSCSGRKAREQLLDKANLGGLELSEFQVWMLHYVLEGI
ncbi:hypothetical protein C8J57DRAFT_83437 [Mycena rebaudengoi]|nr:hypothetical protein C8J57DRAFT_83437 [Mycena rebaudengoi]